MSDPCPQPSQDPRRSTPGERILGTLDRVSSWLRRTRRRVKHLLDVELAHSEPEDPAHVKDRDVGPWEARLLKIYQRLLRFARIIWVLGVRRLWVRLRRYARSSAGPVKLQDAQRFIFITIFVGVVVGFVVAAFVGLINLTTMVLFGGAGGGQITGNEAWWRLLLMPIAGGLVTGIILNKWAKSVRGSGIPQTKIDLELNRGHIDTHVPFSRIGLSSVTLGSGISLGKEGPTVQVGAGIASLLGRIFNLPQRQIENLVPVGVAAGIAAAFKTPLAAVVFVLEEILGKLNAPVLGSTVLAAVSAAFVADQLIPGDSVFDIDRQSRFDHFSFGIILLMYAFFLLQGWFSGYLSVRFVNLMFRIRAWFKGLPKWTQPFHPAMAGVVVAVIALLLFHPQIMGDGHDTIGQLLDGNIEAAVSWDLGNLFLTILSGLVALLILKAIATAVSFGSGAAGGIFTPTLMVGAMSGALIGLLASLVIAWIEGVPWSELDTRMQIISTFALVGMAGMFAGVVGNPITSVLMVFEMTHDFQLVLPLMVVTAISYGLRRSHFKRGFYEAIVYQDGIQLKEREWQEPAQNASVGDIMVEDPFAMSGSTSVLEAMTLSLEKSFSNYVVRSDDGQFLGILSRRDLITATTQNRDAEPIADVVAKNSPVTHEDHPLSVALERMGGFQCNALPVVDRRDSTKLIGIVTLTDILHTYGVDRIPDEFLDRAIRHARKGQGKEPDDSR